MVEDGAGRRRFAQAVVQDAVYGSLARATRAPLHQRVARRLIAIAPPDVDAIARHLRETDDAPGRRLWLRRAAEQARTRFAHATAAEHLDALLPLLAGRERTTATLALAAAEREAGRWDAAERRLRALVPAVHGRARAEAALALGGLLLDRGALEDALELLADAERALAALRDVEGRGRALGRLAVARFRSGDHEAARRLADLRLRGAVRAGDDAGRVQALDVRGIARWAAGDLGGARADLDEGLRLARARRRPDEVLVLANDLAGVHATAGRIATARRCLADALRAAEDAGAVAVRAVMEANAAELALAAGDPRGAVERSTAAARLATRTGDRPNLANALGGAGRALAALGDASGARLVLRRAVALAGGTGDDYLRAEFRAALRALPASAESPSAAAAELLALARRGRYLGGSRVRRAARTGTMRAWPSPSPSSAAAASAARRSPEPRSSRSPRHPATRSPAGSSSRIPATTTTRCRSARTASAWSGPPAARARSTRRCGASRGRSGSR